MNRRDMILSLYSLYRGLTNGQWYLSWLESQTDAQLEMYHKRAFKNEN